MILLEYADSGCMRLGATRKHESRRPRRARGAVLASAKNASADERTVKRGLTRRKIIELLFESCIDCGKMAAIPQGAFAACKVHRNLERDVAISTMDEKEKMGKENVYNGRPPLEGWELTPLKYNSKLMNSIWGLYNRYSVHNFKKNTDSDEGVSGVFTTVRKAFFESQSTVVNNSQIIASRNSI